MNACSKTVTVGCSLFLAAALQAGCAATPKTPPPAPVVQTKSVPQPRPQFLTGKVVETMNSGGYTYVNLEKDGKTTWLAIPSTKVEVGQDLKVWSGMEMGKFTSRTLNRTFDNITFSSGIATDDAARKNGNPGVDGANATMPKGHPALGQQTRLPEGHPQTSAQNQANGSTISGKVIDTMNSGGYTYVNIEKDGKTTWVALPVIKVSVGQELELANGPEMKNFSSAGLNRTFDNIIFSAGPVAGK